MKRKIFILFSCLCLISGLISAQEPYKLPPKEIVDIVTAPPTPRVSISPNGDKMLLIESESLPSIAYMSQPLLRIAGTRITPKYNSRQVTSFNTGITIKTIRDGRTVRVTLPEDIKISSIQWSYDGSKIAFTRYTEDGIELWTADTQTGLAKALTGPIINATLNSGFQWLPGSQHLLAYIIDSNRGNPPEMPAAPIGPNIQETGGRVAKVRTLQDLLKNPHDEALFDYYATSQIREINASNGDFRHAGTPGIYPYADPSPDGKYLLVYRVKKPYSYMVSYRSFPHTMEIWDRSGEMVHLFADIPLADNIPIRGVPKGRRSADWRPLQPATLVWAEALDEGDPENQVPHRDKIMTQAAPFEDDPAEITRVEHRYGGLTWLQQKGKAFLSESNWKKRWRTTYLVDVDDSGFVPKKLFDLSTQDRYNDPGRPIFTTTSEGERIVLQDRNWIYLSGSGSSPIGDMPFLDRMNLETMKKERLFQCEGETYESFVSFAGDSKRQIITRFESKTEPPNYYLYTLRNKQRNALTDYEDPAPQLTGITKQLVKYEREDGVPLSGTLYLPPDYEEGDKLPLVLWAYPREYSDPKLAGQIRGSPHRFTFFRGYSQLFFVTQGYALLDNAQMPVMGDPTTMNDTLPEQLVASAKAAIEKLDSMGVIDPNRVGVGGHSYGAFMTGNLLAHTDLISAGIARSGAYNRTLTPFGFQSERRTFWQAPQTYFKVSPFMQADKVNEPILLIHGEADNNSGTFPIQSKRFYHALKGHGATAKLVMLPNESHGYRAKESVLHVLAEMIEWLDKYVKNK
jgi:dipeptidyl aminopeptidase/acylaminoacyl peptidase